MIEKCLWFEIETYNIDVGFLKGNFTIYNNNIMIWFTISQLKKPKNGMCNWYNIDRIID